MRMLHELSDYDDAVFVTLTYDEDHIPSNHSLKKATYRSGSSVCVRRSSLKKLGTLLVVNMVTRLNVPITMLSYSVFRYVLMIR